MRLIFPAATAPSKRRRSWDSVKFRRQAVAVHSIFSASVVRIVIRAALFFTFTGFVIIMKCYHVVITPSRERRYIFLIYFRQALPPGGRDLIPPAPQIIILMEV